MHGWRKSTIKKKGENERDRQTDKQTDGQMRERILMNHYSYMVNN